MSVLLITVEIRADEGLSFGAQMNLKRYWTIYGANSTDNPDNNPHLELEGHERLDIRLMFGFDF